VSQLDVDAGRFDGGSLGLGGWVVKTGVGGVLRHRFGEPAPAPVIVVDAAAGVYDRVESGHVDRVACGELPPRVEGDKTLLEVQDSVGPVSVEDFVQLVTA
jgi:hypothetical protein